jgi:hypothetical protein
MSLRMDFKDRHVSGLVDLSQKNGEEHHILMLSYIDFGSQQAVVKTVYSAPIASKDGMVHSKFSC